MRVTTHLLSRACCSRAVCAPAFIRAIAGRLYAVLHVWQRGRHLRDVGVDVIERRGDRSNDWWRSTWTCVAVVPTLRICRAVGVAGQRHADAMPSAVLSITGHYSP
ncbi:hypothetical protein NPIL_692741 [Nephila pilipes]|uniref:Uncharacterized protein n=1 Tax=Nephila pilipes TaxID=299642 RepID=A0A8X6QDS1_NEPPI|nr:hypothetical protein NPIL_692741 [Nephila pilipes]